MKGRSLGTARFIASLGNLHQLTPAQTCATFSMSLEQVTPLQPNVSKIKNLFVIPMCLAPPEPLTLQQIQNEVQAGKNSTTGEVDYSQLEALLQEKLKKFAAFNSCFGTGQPITYEHCGVDLEETRRAFALLLAMVWLDRVVH